MFSFAERTRFGQHPRRTTPSFMDSSVCPYCDQKFKGSRGLAIHLSGRANTACFQKKNSGEAVQPSKVCDELLLITDLPSLAEGVPNSQGNIIINDEPTENFHMEAEEMEPHSPELSSPGLSQDHEFDLNHSPEELGQQETISIPSVQRARKRRTEKTYNSNLEFIYALKKCRNNQGLSLNDMNRLIRLVKDPRFNVNEISIKSASDVERFFDDFRSLVFGEEVMCEVTFQFIGLNVNA